VEIEARTGAPALSSQGGGALEAAVLSLSAIPGLGQFVNVDGQLRRGLNRRWTAGRSRLADKAVPTRLPTKWMDPQCWWEEPLIDAYLR